MNRISIQGFGLRAAMLAGLLSGCGGGESSDPLPALNTIRDAELGIEMTVDGFISTSLGAFESSTGDVGFAIQDNTGGVYIQVDPALNLDLSALSFGDKVEITGVVGNLDELVTLTIDEASDIVPLSGGFIFFPTLLDTGQIADTVNQIDRESTSVAIAGNLVLDPDGSGETVLRDEDTGGELLGWKIWLDDGSGVAQTFWHPSANMDPEILTFLTAGAPLRINGFLNRFFDEFEVLPRGDFDISMPMATARGLPLGEKVLVRGLIGLGPAALVTEGDYGFSLHEDNGDGTQDGIFVSIASDATIVNNYSGNPMSLAELIFFVNGGNRKVHVSGVLTATAGGDVILAAGDDDIRLISEPITFPPNVAVATGSVSANLGRWLNATGTLQTPPAGGALGSFTAWSTGIGGFQARINGGSGPVNILFPFEVFGDQNNDGNIDLADLILAQVTGVINFDTVIGGSIQAAGFARNRNGETEIVVPFNLPNYIN
jgi:hypothetical protein